MELTHILDNWNSDVNMNSSDLVGESLKIPKIHSKYLRMYADEKSLLKKLKKQFNKLNLLKIEYYSGTMNGTEELKKLGWEPYQRVILKVDMQKHLDADSDLQKMHSKIEEQEDKVEVLQYIMKEIAARNFNIKNIIEIRKFEAGQ